MTNKNGVPVTWSLYRLKPIKNYPFFIYAWVSPEGIITSMRSTSPIGIMPLGFEDKTGNHKKILRGSGFKKINHKMNDTELEKGWLIL